MKWKDEMMNSSRVLTMLLRFGKDRAGATTTEYGLLLIFVVAVIVASITALGVVITGFFQAAVLSLNA